MTEARGMGCSEGIYCVSCWHKGKGLTAHMNCTVPSHRYNESLLEEGKMMHRLRHSRVVKLLGFILEEGNYCLVMEYMEKGNLMQVLGAEVGGTAVCFPGTACGHWLSVRVSWCSLVVGVK